ncbi:ribosome small subunit-dependent GTPase A [Streptomyces sp. 6N223]|uniref:ribosome small subunit-dependent GTPase A n=1 Tax=Streptomyces sp. 6N223 TaxID=3457412 RepID=UPI003FD126F3
MSSSSSTSTSTSSDSPLSAYGWDEAYERAFAGHRDAGLAPARVVGVDRGQCDVVTEDGPARAGTGAGVGSDPALAPCAGDWVGLRPEPGPGPEGLPEVAVVLPRRTAIVRASAGATSHGQVLAANVDTAVVTVSLAEPLDAGRLERMLALVWDSGAQPVVALTKADEAGPVNTAAALVEAAELAPGVDTVATSTVTGEGMDVLRALLGGTVVLLGRSGAGKSTLGNALLGDEVLATGAVRAQDGKGRHTTVRRELLLLPGGGVLIDTPGLRGVGLHDAGGGLERVFAEIEELAEECRFGDCSHDTEPGCAVRAAIEAGELPARRLASYRKLLRENAWAASRTDARLRAERERGRRDITRFQRNLYKMRGHRGRP